MTQVRYSLQREMVHCHAWRWYCYRKHSLLLLYHGRKWSVRNSTYFAMVIITPSGTLKGPTSSLPMINQNMTLPPPCWHCSLIGTWWPSTTPSVWIIQGCSALIRKQDSLKINLHGFLSSLQMFLLVSIGEGRPNKFAGVQRHQNLQLPVCCFVVAF